MKNLKFRYAAAQNFLCFKDRVEFHFEDYGNIVLIKGENFDVMKNGRPSSNGSGKSSIAELISYCLYGKTIKPPKKISKENVLHSWNPTKMEVEVWIDDYRILRTKKPDKLRVWQDKNHLWDKSSEVTLGTMAETQKLIDKIIGLTHESFCNVVVFDDANTQGFLKCDLPSKRKIIENLLGLECYKDYFENSKNLLKEYKDKIKIAATEYQLFQSKLDGQDSALEKVKKQEADWKTNLNNQCDNLMLRIRQKQQSLESLDVSDALKKYQEAQEEMLKLNASIPDMETTKEKAINIAKECRNKIDQLRSAKSDIEINIQQCKVELISATNEIENHKKIKESFNGLKDGENCPVCRGVIESKNYNSVIEHSDNVIISQKAIFDKISSLCKEYLEDLEKKKKSLSALENSLDKANDAITGFELKIDNVRKKVVYLSKIEKPQLDSNTKVLESEIVGLRKQLEEKKASIEGDSPYKEIIEDSKREQQKSKDILESKKNHVKELEAEIPYLEYWKEGFGDKGIRKFVIDRVIPALNARLSYLMQYLMDDQIKIVFDNELEETIDQKPDDGNPFVYEILSNGEKQRIDFALSQGLGYIRILECGACPSLLFLDEITKGAVDFNGVQGIYNMILELAKERQVFITTHDVNLLSLLEGCDQINLRKESGSTKVV